MANFQAFANAQEVVVRDVGGNVADRFAHTDLKSTDAELERRGYILEFGDWLPERVGGGTVHYRRMNK